MVCAMPLRRAGEFSNMVARLSMRDFSDAFLEAYLDAVGANVTASVGAYQLERTGVHLFERIEGDHFTIADISTLVLIELAGRAKLAVPEERLNLRRWYAAVSARPSWVCARA